MTIAWAINWEFLRAISWEFYGDFLMLLSRDFHGKNPMNQTMKNLLQLHENLAISPLKFSQNFNGFWFHSAGHATIFRKKGLVKTKCVAVCALKRAVKP